MIAAPVVYNKHEERSWWSDNGGLPGLLFGGLLGGGGSSSSSSSGGGGGFPGLLGLGLSYMMHNRDKRGAMKAENLGYLSGDMKKAGDALDVLNGALMNKEGADLTDEQKAALSALHLNYNDREGLLKVRDDLARRYDEWKPMNNTEYGLTHTINGEGDKKFRRYNGELSKIFPQYDAQESAKQEVLQNSAQPPSPTAATPTGGAQYTYDVKAPIAASQVTKTEGLFNNNNQVQPDSQVQVDQSQPQTQGTQVSKTTDPSQALSGMQQIDQNNKKDEQAAQGAQQAQEQAQQVAQDTMRANASSGGLFGGGFLGTIGTLAGMAAPFATGGLAHTLGGVTKGIGLLNAAGLGGEQGTPIVNSSTTSSTKLGKGTNINQVMQNPNGNVNSWEQLLPTDWRVGGRYNPYGGSPYV